MTSVLFKLNSDRPLLYECEGFEMEEGSFKTILK